MPPSGFDILAFIWDAFLVFLAWTWWFWLFFILFGLARSAWLTWRQYLYKHAITWVFFEIRIPRLNEKSPQGMEQVLSAIHALKNQPNDLGERYWDGEVTRWYSFEMVSFGGEVHFYLRAPFRQKNLIQAAFFAYYPDVEVSEVPDYIDRLPINLRELYAEGLELWGSEMILRKSGMYPIKSYHDFEAIEEEQRFDPISSFLEVLGKLNADEFVGIQFNCAPIDLSWHEEFEHTLQKLKETKVRKGESKTSDGLQTLSGFTVRSPGETDILKAVEKNLSKPAFEVIARFVYLSPRATFYDTYPRRGLTGAFNQYQAIDLNGFSQNYEKSTRTKVWNFPYLFPKRRNERRKQRLLHDYLRREIPEHTLVGKFLVSDLVDWGKSARLKLPILAGFKSKMFILNLESLATLFHPPTALVLTAPHLKRIESRKGSPPAGLAIFGEEGEIEKFQ